MKDVAIIGAGIVGLAHAYTLAKQGWRVRVYERSLRAQGASIRNFGMLWPIGQPAGDRAAMAMRSAEIWREVLRAAQLWHDPVGSLHAAYHADEVAVAQEFAAAEPERARWIGPEEALRISPALVPNGLLGALHSVAETIVDPRLVVRLLPEFLDEVYGVEFHFGFPVADPHVLPADLVLIANGADFESLYPSVFAASDLTRVKLQMLRTAAQPEGWRLGPALAAGLTLRFYKSFAHCPSLPALAQRINETMLAYDRWGIHVMASHMPDGTVTLGDSHEYGLEVDTFNKEEIDDLILAYLRGFVQLPEMAIAERWYGVYAKHPSLAYFLADPEPNIKIVNGVGGAGMTLSFGLAERVCSNL
ncbi:MAG: TIGR03364 family FAD-dependent oxidoreductase [Bryobacter sp.]